MLKTITLAIFICSFVACKDNTKETEEKKVILIQKNTKESDRVQIPMHGTKENSSSSTNKSFQSNQEANK